jgi:hypothetical protein
MQRIVINNCFGGFSLSHEGVMAYAKRKGIKLYPFVEKRVNGHMDFNNFESYDGQHDIVCIHYSTKPLPKNGKYSEEGYFRDRDIKRDDPDLIAVVKKLGKKANGICADLKVVEIPDGVKWEIDEYDGNEHVQEECRKWS